MYLSHRGLEESLVDWEPWLCSISCHLGFDENLVSMASHHHYISALFRVVSDSAIWNLSLSGEVSYQVSLWHPPRKPNSPLLVAVKLLAEKYLASPRGRRLPWTADEDDRRQPTRQPPTLENTYSRNIPFLKSLDISFSVNILCDIVWFVRTSGQLPFLPGLWSSTRELCESWHFIGHLRSQRTF